MPVEAAREQLIQEFLGLLPSKDATSDTSPQKIKLLTKIDGEYWAESAKIVQAVLHENEERLLFNKYQRLVLDAGLLDERLLGPQADQVKTALIRELYADAHPQHHYLSQWLADRYRNHLALARLDAASQQAAEAAPATSQIDELNAASKKIFLALKPFFQNLPGFSAAVTDLLCDGRLDRSWQDLAIQCLIQHSEAAAEQRDKLLDIRRRLLAKAKSRCETQKQLALFDALANIDLQVHRAISEHAEVARNAKAKAAREAEQRSNSPLSFKERLDFLQGELKLVRSLLRLGTTGSGITKTHSTLTDASPRTTKGSLAEQIRLIQQSDISVSSSQIILIAPYVGTGFFEWDRDTVFIPMIPTRGEDESIVVGLANYRIMIDNLHNNQILKRSYEREFGAGDFRSNFIRDYKSWVLGIGKGFRGAMDKERFNYFKSKIGPSSDKLFAPKELTPITPEDRLEELKRIRAKINKGEALATDHYKLAIIYWTENRIQDSLSQLSLAVKMDPTDVRAMFSLGYACIKMGINDKSEKAFKECITIGQNTIWQVYASEYLGKL
ncbi:MAG: hypothetical protein HYY93_16000 [Planctomycetes bacterium]|nr:hypothetical protein [Planctomycetota bacterium]